MAERTPVIAIVGGGPRGASMLERLAAHFTPDTRAEILVFEPDELGAGRIWRTDQPRNLVMNTYAGQVTLFTDASVECAGEIVPGPGLLEWAQNDPAGRAAAAELEPAPLEAWSHPTRALFGRYLRWFADRAIAALPAGVTVTHLRARAKAVTADETGFTVAASDAEWHADAVVLALGWLPRDDAALAPGALPWVPPGNPIEQPLDRLEAGSDVAVRGLGMGFTDALILLTEGRGGRFLPAGPVLDSDPLGPQRLRYEPSGEEPRLFIGSRSGIPFRSKSVYRALPPVPDAPRTAAALREATHGAADFARDFWPAICADADAAFAATKQDASARLELSALASPLPPECTDPERYADWFTAYLSQDLREAAAGSASPLKAAAWVIASQRARIAEFASFGGFVPESSADYRDYMALGGKLGSGPPLFRTAQLLACIDAGIVRPFGPDPELVLLDADGADGSGRNGSGAAELRTMDGSRQPVTAVLDAWMHPAGAVSTNDPLVRGLLGSGLARAHVHRSPGSSSARPTEALDIDPGTSRLVGADGRVDRPLFSIGIPQEPVRGYSVISPIPGTNSALLRETDAVARDIVGGLRS